MSNDLMFSTRNIPGFGWYSTLNIFFQSVLKHGRAVIFGTIYECMRIQHRPPIDRLRYGTPLKALDTTHLNGVINIPAAAVAVYHGLYFLF